MDKKDLLVCSPVRKADGMMDGGLKAGEMGLVTAKKGVGKTSVLVQFGLDSLLQGKPVVHVSFDQHSSNVVSWYDSVFSEILKKKSMADMAELKDSITRDRMIFNCSRETFTLDKVVSMIKTLKAAGINIQTIIVDGISLDKVADGDMEAMASFVKDEGMTAWFSDTKEGEKLADSCPAVLAKQFAVVCHLSAVQTGVSLNVLKLRDKKADGSISLDAKTLLMK